MQEFATGQRWINYAELAMGLGTVVSVDFRTVTLIFPACGETRTYAKQTAPLARIALAPGDTATSHEGWSMTVSTVSDDGSLLSYSGIREDGSPASLAEGQLDCSIQLNRPAERLFSGQIDKDRWFELRYATLQHARRLAHSALYGLTGVRTSLIPHQLYIAHEVAQRHAPRVLLADEVGLGKTIEAGLILHHQLLTGRASRVLIVVPESLIHQWLVEMLRRFNLHFSLFDEARCEAMEEAYANEEDSEAEPVTAPNPFHQEQRVLTSLEFLTRHPQRFRQAHAGDWDLLVVDEAHHLQWAPEGASLEYELVELLAAETRGVLLLTATPEQLGKRSHYARLRLLDPERFPDYESFLAGEQDYAPIAAAVQALLDDEALDAQTTRLLQDTLLEGDNQSHLQTLNSSAPGSEHNRAARQALVNHLLDRHGTGRVLFRNTRASIKGFPGRQLHACPLPCPAAYADLLANADHQAGDRHLLLCPELLMQGQTETWTRIDPRMDWLQTHLKALWPHKVLVITANANTAMDISEALRVRAGLHAPVFHEQMSILERDRAAAFFADAEFGCQALICSEIGSEGRNFQFAHHLILFDLPLNPDLLEQRIGRLDRIGQQQDIQIHVPYLEHTAQEVMFRWYHHGLGAFENICPAGHSVFSQVESMLLAALHQAGDDMDDLAELVDTTHEIHQRLNEELRLGRDRLLEYNSCRPQQARALQVQAEKEEDGSVLWTYLEQVFDCFGVDTEDNLNGSHILRPGEHMQHDSFPGLHADGMTATCTRAMALAHEDMQFLSWEHPLVSGAMEMVTGSELGNTALTAIQWNGVARGSLLLECVFLLDALSGRKLQTSRYLPPSAIRIVIDQQGRDHAAGLDPDTLRRERKAVPPDTAIQVIRGYSQPLRNMLKAAEALAQQQTPALVEHARQQAKQTLGAEVERLTALGRLNPNVRQSEIDFFSRQWDEVMDKLAGAGLRLDALRVIVVT